MRIVEFSIRRPVTVAMATAAVLIFGLISLSNLSLNLLPNITFPTLTIRTEYPGSAPSEVESLVSKRIEEVVGIISGVVRVSSVSRPGLSDCIVEFNWGTNMDLAAIDIREKLDGVNLPKDADKPVLLRFDPALDPIMRISLYGTDNLVALRLAAEEQIKRRLESIEGVASILVSGGYEEEIRVELEEAKLARLGIPISQVADRLSRENINLTGGTLKDGEVEFLVRTLNQFLSLEEIGRIVVEEKGPAVIRLQDVGEATRSIKDRRIITRTGGVESVELSVFKEADTNTVTVADTVKERLGNVAGDLSQTFSDVEIQVIADQSTFITQSIQEVLKTALWGGLLAVIILYFFLRNIRSTLIISLAIPISVIAAFFLMFLSNISLNIMSLGGLALGIGMLVDNSIVVLESINRHRAEKKSLKEAANLGASEVAGAVTAATLTTICVFVPIIFVQGVAGQLFIDQALTVTYSLLASLLLALTLIPMLSSVRLEGAATSDSDGVQTNGGPYTSESSPKGAPVVRVLVFPIRIIKIGAVGVARFFRLILTPLYFVFEKVFGLLSKFYPRTLKWALSHKILLLLAAAGIFAGSLLMIGFLGSELIPEVSQGAFTVDIETPTGTPLFSTDSILAEMERIAEARDDIGVVYSIAGASGSFSSSPAEEKENIGQLSVTLEEELPRGYEIQVMEGLREKFRDIPGLDFQFSQPSLFTFKAPIEVEIQGYNLQGLAEIAGRVVAELESIPGLRDVRSNLEAGYPELQIFFNRPRLAAMGLNVETVAGIIRQKILGEVATEYSSRDRDIDVRVRVREEDLKGLADLYNLTISTQNNTAIKLSSVADIRIARGLSEIYRLDQERTAVVQANLSGIDLGSAVSLIQGAIDGLSLSEEFSVEIGGQRQEMAISFASMRLAILLAVCLVYMVMAAQFESLLHPLVIMMTIPFGIVGVIFFLLVTGTSISVVVLIGTVMLAGIVVNNAIVLVDYINRLRKAGMEKEQAILEAGTVRLRPILMTTLTTIFGLIPMALGLGEGAEIRSPMAITLIGGLIVSSFLTLVLIPTVYAIFDRRR